MRARAVPGGHRGAHRKYSRARPVLETGARHPAWCRLAGSGRASIPALVAAGFRSTGQSTSHKSLTAGTSSSRLAISRGSPARGRPGRRTMAAALALSRPAAQRRPTHAVLRPHSEAPRRSACGRQVCLHRGKAPFVQQVLSACPALASASAAPRCSLTLRSADSLPA